MHVWHFSDHAILNIFSCYCLNERTRAEKMTDCMLSHTFLLKHHEAIFRHFNVREGHLKTHLVTPLEIVNITLLLSLVSNRGFSECFDNCRLSFVALAYKWSETEENPFLLWSFFSAYVEQNKQLSLLVPNWSLTKHDLLFFLNIFLKATTYWICFFSFSFCLLEKRCRSFSLILTYNR